LLASGISSQAAVDRALHVRDEARQQVAAAQQQIASVLASLVVIRASRPTNIRQYQQAQGAARPPPNINLSYTVITAPSDGVVTKVEQLQVGDYIAASTPAFALISNHDLWVEANFKEVQLTHMRAGRPPAWSSTPTPARASAQRWRA